MPDYTCKHREGENRLEKIEEELKQAGPHFSLDPTEWRPAEYCVDAFPHGKSLTHPVVYIKGQNTAGTNIIRSEKFVGAE